MKFSLYSLTFLMLCSSPVTSQSSEYFHFFDTGNNNIFVSTPCSFDGESILFLSSGIGSEAMGVSAVVYNFVDESQDVFDISSSYPEGVENVGLLELDNELVTYGNYSLDSSKIWLGIFSNDLEISTLFTFNLWGLLSESVEISALNVKKFSEDYLIVYGTVVSSSSQRKNFFIETDGSFNVKRVTTLNQFQTLQDVLFYNDTLIVDDANTFALYPNADAWVDIEIGLDAIFFQCNLETVDDGIVGTGQISNSLEFRRGNIILKTDFEGVPISSDSIGFVSDDFPITYNANSGLHVDDVNGYIITAGTSEITPSAGVVLQYTPSPSMLYASVYDNDLNNLGKHLFGGDSFYYTSQTNLLDNLLVICGTKFDSDLDTLVTFLGVIPIDVLVGSTKVESREDKEIVLFPNPATESIRVSDKDVIGDYEIFGSSGQVVLRGEVDSSSSINCSELSPGVYFITVLSQSGTSYSGKFVII